jgi:hypothetical protein
MTSIGRYGVSSGVLTFTMRISIFGIGSKSGGLLRNLNHKIKEGCLIEKILLFQTIFWERFNMPDTRPACVTKRMGLIIEGMSIPSIGGTHEQEEQNCIVFVFCVLSYFVRNYIFTGIL